MGAHVLFFMPVHILHIDGGLELDDHGGAPDPGQMILEDIRRIHDDHGHHRHAAFLRYLEAPFMEGQEGVVHLVAGSLREDAQGHPPLHLLHPRQDGLQTLLDIVPVQEQTVDVPHPVSQQRIAQHLLFRHIARDSGEMGIGKHDVEIAAVVPDEEGGAVRRDVLLPPDDELRASQPCDAPKPPAHQGLGEPVPVGGISLCDEMFRYQHGDGENQEQKQVQCH